MLQPVAIIVVIVAVLVKIVSLVRKLTSRRAVAKLGLRYPGYALVTGASAGIGERVRRLFARGAVNSEKTSSDDGQFVYSLAMEESLAGVVMVATEKSKAYLDTIREVVQKSHPNCDLRVVTADLSTPEGCQHVLDSTKDIDVSVLVNNAGFGLNGAFHKLDIARQVASVELNCTAPVKLSHHFINKRTVQEGRSLAIVMVGSMSGLAPGIPFFSIYAATKSFLASFARGLALEHPNVDVLLIEPGTISGTHFQKTAGQPHHEGHVSPEQCVLWTLDALKAHKGGLEEMIFTPKDTLMGLAMRYFPQSIILPLAKKRGLKYSPKELQ